MHHILAAATDNADIHSTPLTSTQYQSLPLTIQPAVADPSKFIDPQGNDFSAVPPTSPTG
jgi:hypothetical protein